MNEKRIKKDQTSDVSPENVPNTYGDVEALYIADVRAKGASKQQIRNVRSALKFWREALKLDLSSPLGAELGDLFAEKIVFYARQQKALSIRKSTYAPRISRIKKGSMVVKKTITETFSTK
jgi:hypothetical protein